VHITSGPANPTNSSSASFSFTASDTGPGSVTTECKLDSGSFAPCTSPKGYTGLAEGSHTVEVKATDAAGNHASDSFTWVVDTTAPIIAVTGFTDGQVFVKGVDPLPTPGCSAATDAGGSGIASQDSTPTKTADTRDANGVGSVTYRCSATDNAGNVGANSRTFKVIYNWTGFFQPVDNLPALNKVKAGSAIPVKFNLGGNQGLNIFMAGYPTSAPIACGNTASADAIEETVTAGQSSLTYDTTASQYIYVWKTVASWSNSCRTLSLKLTDGTTRQANFYFVK
jgi:hypothetical protein